MAEVLGIDIGGTGIKGAIVETKTGQLISDRVRYDTPKDASPKYVSDIVFQLAKDFNWTSKQMVGIGFPTIVKKGTCLSASNISDEWIGMNINQHFQTVLNTPFVSCINDADAAGTAEITYGKGINNKETILLLTLGTGIGSALFREGILIPNTEFGILYFKNTIAEKYASNKIRVDLDLSWEDWSIRLNEVLLYYEFIISPDLIILGGGVSKALKKYQSYLTTNCPIVKAKLKNRAGIIGAAKTADLAFVSFKQICT